MGFFSFKLPDLGEGIVESEITEWFVKVGDVVEEDQHIADVMTDKATVEVGSPVAGKIVSLACEAGDILAVGHELIRFEVEGDGNMSGGDVADVDEVNKPDVDVESEQESITTSEDAVTADVHSKQETAPVEALEAQASSAREEPNTFAGAVLASPSVRKRAREESIDLSLVAGSGPAGRIGHKDIEAFIAAGGALAVRPTYAGRAKKTGSQEVKVIGLRRAIARKMQQSKRSIPHYSYVEEVDVTELETLRQTMNASRAENLPKLTLLPFLVKVLVKVLPDFPHCNARYDDENDVVTYHDGVHAGIATMTDNGLMVPVVKHAEALSVWEIAAEITRVSGAARGGTAKGDELTGSTITITSLGAIGGIVTTPVINAPETSIIGVNKMVERPVVVDGQITVRKMMNLSSSFDHRIVDGFDGAQLVQAMKRLLEAPGMIFAEDR